MSEVIKEIDNYLQAGGMFNPEEMEPHKVRDLLLKCRNSLTKVTEDLEFADKVAAHTEGFLWQLSENQQQEIARLNVGLNEQIQWVSDLADDLIQAEKKIADQQKEIDRLKEKCDNQAMVIRRSYPENFPDTWFVANGIGQKDANNLPQYIWVCPAFGVDWLQVYEKTERTVGGMGS